MTIAEKLRGLAVIADHDPSEVRWRLLTLLDGLDADIAAEMRRRESHTEYRRYIADAMRNVA
jgi:hypothetical protein